MDKLRIIKETPDYLVIDKPFGVIVNRSDTTTHEMTLQDIIEKEGVIDKNDPDEEFIKRAGIVHRLDKETSGIMIIARNSIAFRILQAQFKDRRVEKSYVALAHGEIIPKTGSINVPVGRLPWNRMRFGVLAGGRESVTLYETISNIKSKDFGELTFVRLFPKTGRTHQIRVHLKHINHPIFSDPLYTGRKVSRGDRKVLPRVFLHAEKITFFDPKTDEKVSYESELSSDLAEFLKLISASNN